MLPTPTDPNFTVPTPSERDFFHPNPDEDASLLATGAWADQVDDDPPDLPEIDLDPVTDDHSGMEVAREAAGPLES